MYLVPFHSGVILSDIPLNIALNTIYFSFTASLNLNGIKSSSLSFTFTPAQNDLIPVRNQLFEIANTNITITMQDDAGTGTVTTSSSVTGATSSITVGTANGSTTTY